MNKTEFVDFISQKADLTKAAAARALDAVFEGITVTLVNGDPIVFTGFGAFTVQQRAAREGLNPSTGEKIKINATKVVKFKAGKALKDAVKDS